MERRAGSALFERTSRRVRLTPLGAQLRYQLQPAYTQLTAAFEGARAAARGVSRLLRVGFTVTIPSEPLTGLIEAFEARNPDCQVSMVEHRLDAGDRRGHQTPVAAGD